MAKKILIVDDSSSVRTIARTALREQGYEVVEAGNGREALEKLYELKRLARSGE